MAADTSHRKRAVLYTIPTIRWLLSQHGFQMDAYSDDTIAEALIDTCATPDDFWLRSEHLNLAVRRINAAQAPRPPALDPPSDNAGHAKGQPPRRRPAGPR